VGIVIPLDWRDVDFDLDEVGVDAINGGADCLIKYRGNMRSLLSYQRVTRNDVALLTEARDGQRR
jgi:hypothetical protein